MTTLDRRNTWLATAALALLAGGVIAPAPAWSAVPACSDPRARTTKYVGPGRELAAPAGLERVAVGYFGPHQPGSYDTDLWLAAQMAAADVNAAGGCRGLPLKLVPAWSKNPWGTGVGQLTHLVYQTGIWALIGGPDGASTHLAEQVVAKARLVLLSPGSTDSSVHQANVPWMFSCLPNDHLLAKPLADHLAAVVKAGPFALASADDHDSRQLVAQLTRCLTARTMDVHARRPTRTMDVHVRRNPCTMDVHVRRNAHPLAPQFKYVFKPGQVDMHQLADQLMRGKPAAIVIVADPKATAQLVRALRKLGYDRLIVGGPAMGRRQFVEQAGDVAGEIVFPLLWQPTAQAAAFADRFRARYHMTPDYATAASYDAVRLVAAAIDKAGLNRARIGDALRALAPYQGIAGPIRWDPRGGNSRRVSLGTIRHGRVEPLTDTK